MSAHPIMETERAEFSISELAREFDVTPRAIRFYEDQGLLAPRRDGQRRIYTPRDRTRLKLTLRGKRLGLTLAEIRELIDMYEPGRDDRPQLERFREVLESHRKSLLQQALAVAFQHLAEALELRPVVAAGLVHVDQLADLGERQAQALAAQRELEPGAVARRVDAALAVATRREQSLV